MKYPKTKEHSEFHTEMMSLGCVITGDKWNLQLHHCVGRSYVQNKVPIGHWFVLPLHWRLHDTHSGSIVNVTHFRKNFSEMYGLQRDLFLDRVIKHSLEVPDDVLEDV